MPASSKRGRPSALHKKRLLVEAFFASSKRTLWSAAALATLLEIKRAEWDLPQSQTLERFIEFLCEEIGLKEFGLEFPARTYFGLRGPSVDAVELAQFFGSQGFFSHKTALLLHGFAPEKLAALRPVPDGCAGLKGDLFFTQEKGERTRGCDELEQDKVDVAFARPPRVTNNFALWADDEDTGRLFLLAAKNSNALGIEKVFGESGFEAQVTDLHRTLIDCAVRPFYAGGVAVVAAAFAWAVELASFDAGDLEDMLRVFDFAYPYHQAVGFYLQRVGADTQAISLFAGHRSPLDFYLCPGYERDELLYDAFWKIYYPKALNKLTPNQPKPPLK